MSGWSSIERLLNAIYLGFFPKLVKVLSVLVIDMSHYPSGKCYIYQSGALQIEWRFGLTSDEIDDLFCCLNSLLNKMQNIVDFEVLGGRLRLSFLCRDKKLKIKVYVNSRIVGDINGEIDSLKTSIDEFLAFKQQR